MQALRIQLPRLSLVIGTLVFVISSNTSLVAASSAISQNITMTPSSTELSVLPGGSISNSFDVVNEGDNPYGISVSVAPYHVTGSNYDPLFTPLPGTTDASQWVHITDPTTQTLAAHKLTNINYTADVPAGTAPGGYYAVLFAETTPMASVDTGVVSHNRVGNILYITVQGSIKAGGNLQSLATSFITTASSVPLGMLVSNTGGVHFLTSASITVKSILNTTVFHAVLQRYVLPQTIRKVSTVWNSTPPIGLYQVERSATVAGVHRSLPTQWILIIHPLVIAILAIVLFIVIVEIVLKRRARRAKGREEK